MSAAQEQGYYRSPTLHGQRVVFVCETDLWTVDAAGGAARRLTANVVEATSPRLSPDGTRLAFVGREEGTREVYVMPAAGGAPRRLTYLGAGLRAVVGWTPDGERVVFASSSGQPFARSYRLWEVPHTGGPPQLLPYGRADRVAFAPDGRGVLLGRNIGDPARWKRYRGGTAGELWIDPEGQGRFRPLLRLGGNLADPMWIGARLYFLSDHEGHGNLYSCTPAGEDLVRHTHHEDYYARNASSDGERIVYQHAARLRLFDPATGEDRPLDVSVRSSKPQLTRRFVKAADYLDDFDLHPKGHSLALVVRGKPFTMPNWEEAVRQHGARHGVRHRLARFLHDGERFVCVSDADGEEALEVHTANAPPGEEPRVRRLQGVDIGRPYELVVSPLANQIVLANHRHELLWVDLDAGRGEVLDRSDHGRIRGMAFSPDGRAVAYGFQGTSRTVHLRLVELEGRTVTPLTEAVHVDANPSFDPSGKYLYFVSYRTFNPIYDNIYFDLGFPRGGKVYLLTLQADAPSPLLPPARGLDGEDLGASGESPERSEATPGKKEKKKDKKRRKKEKKQKKKRKEEAKRARERTRIDLEGIADRVVELPVPEGIYGAVEALSGKVLYTRWPPRGAMDDAEDEGRGELLCFDLDARKEECWVEGLVDWSVSLDRKALAYETKNALRVVKTSSKPDASDEGPPARSNGRIDLDRVRVAVVPASEWRQMYREAWRLQRDNFWSPNLANLDWNAVYERYLPVLERVATRAEFSDLMWEMQGELGTSHAYEFGGDYPRRPPPLRVGALGADLVPRKRGWQVERVVRGDGWSRGATSPLAAPGVDVREGDRILSIAGEALTKDRTPGELLVHRAGTLVELVVQRGKKKPRRVVVETLRDETPARYRAWVETNRRFVHERSAGRLGYVHVPDMGPRGFAEFHRYYQQEIDRTGLIVDVRFNGGGHVSQLLLEKLARKRVGYDVPRWGKPIPYPEDSVLGPIVCLTNEHAGSDGDIFSHCFKLMKLGPLIGKRTWGGVVGIWPRHPLVDRTVTTQAEFAFWFEDVGFGVENYGTEPDIEVEDTPQDGTAGRDPQLERALAVALERLEKERPTIPDFGPPPDLRPPRLAR